MIGPLVVEGVLDDFRLKHRPLERGEAVGLSPTVKLQRRWFRRSSDGFVYYFWRDVPIAAWNASDEEVVVPSDTEPELGCKVEPKSGSAVVVPPSDVSELYYELLYAVEGLFPGESRHETALRYIREVESGRARKSGE